MNKNDRDLALTSSTSVPKVEPSPKKKRKVLNEITIIRALACLSIVMLHSTTFTVNYAQEGILVTTLATILCFGTPTFVFISGLILAYSYPNNLPKGFYWKRIKLILFPFIFMAIFYAVFSGRAVPEQIPSLIWNNLTGGYHGWFVLVIFQFYVLHHLFTKFFSKLPAALVLSVSLIINVAYLSIFNFIQPTSHTPFTSYLWSGGYYIPFVAWLFYFSLSYYCGKNFMTFVESLKRFKALIFFFLIVSLGVLIYNNVNEYFAVGSKRIDIIFFTVMMILFLLLVCQSFKKTPKILTIVSQYSFGIYLAHWFYLTIIRDFIASQGWELGYMQIPLLFISALISCIITINILNRFPFGKYMIGKINRKKQTPVKKETVVTG
ncbi:acyltransferase family protein [Priestia endophytica]|uniref:acyltransferase family protein n=1 Tax=Priestia endophytica TaxID=135735 RepID=UPI00227F03B3|nr:acyltransferase family protein [Priestia endophytica]MCY8234654.1 acyltransferase family protein [Priestia endophytica]